ncbi:MAG: hypothetical protein IJZ15_04875 [Oscillospiraceae bacterium]|nr:hypothetical protein [Oscillospiraceae bacterium]
MIVTHKLKMSLEEEEILQRLEMPLGDVSTRKIEMQLYANRKLWTIPENVTVLIQYKKPDGTVGEYDTLPDGSAAWSVYDNVLTLTLAPQVLTAVGSVVLYASLYLEEAVLHTFAVEICVRAPLVSRSAVRSAGSEEYYYVTNVLRGPITAQTGQILTAGTVDDSGRVTQVEAMDTADLVREKSNAVLHTAQTLTASQQFQARTNIAAASQAEVDFLLAKFNGTGIVLADIKTGERYTLYVENGKLIMEKE